MVKRPLSHSPILNILGHLSDYLLRGEGKERLKPLIRESHFFQTKQPLFLSSSWLSAGENVLKAKPSYRDKIPGHKTFAGIYNFKALQVSSIDVSG